MYSDFTVFEILSMNDDRIKEFDRFFMVNGLEPLFVREHQATPIRTSDLDLRSVVNTGTAAKPFLELADFILIFNDNKRYDSAMFRLIDEPQSFQKFVTIIRRTVNYWYEIEDEHRPNFWNIVFYDGTLQGVPAVIFY